MVYVYRVIMCASGGGERPSTCAAPRIEMFAAQILKRFSAAARLSVDIRSFARYVLGSAINVCVNHRVSMRGGVTCGCCPQVFWDASVTFVISFFWNKAGTPPY